MKKLLVLCIGALMLLSVGCSKENNKKAEVLSDKKTVCVSNYPLYDFTKKIAKDKLEVINITNNSGFHGWEPSAKDIANIQDSDLFIYSGHGLEKWADDIIEKKIITTKISEASKNVELLETEHDHEHEGEEHNHEQEEEHDHEHGNFDPHIWLSLRNGKVMLRNIADSLIEIDPENKDFYEENYAKYEKEFSVLDEKYTELFKNTKKDTIIVSHEAYGYLCRDYNFKQVGIEGINAQGEPSIKQIDNILKKVKELGVNTIFYEESISPKVAEMISKEVGAKLELLSPLELITPEQESENKEYLSIMEDNLKGILDALNG